MKKTAIVLFPGICNYEIAVLLEILALNEKPVVFVASSLAPMRCEEKMQVVADIPFAECHIQAYDSLVISGSYAEGLYHNFADERLLDLIRQFHVAGHLIAAISSGPMVLCKAGITKGVPFQAGVSREWLLQDEQMRLFEEDMDGLVDVGAMQAQQAGGSPVPDFLLEQNILTAYGWKFREWAVAFAEYLKLEAYSGSFGL